MSSGAGSITIVVLEEQRLVRLGMTEALAAEPDLEVVGSSAFDDGTLRLLGRLRPDIVLLDGEFGCGRAGGDLRGLGAASPGSKLVAVIAVDDPRLVSSLIVAGAHACVPRTATKDEVLLTLRAAHRARAHVDPGARAAPDRTTQLSQRERQVMTLVAVGMRNSEIARRLFISEGTVKKHLTNTYSKLGAASRMRAVKRAVSLGIVSPGELERPGNYDHPRRSTRERGNGG